MELPIAFAILSAVGLALTLNAFRPLRSEILSVPTFFAGWLVSELPVHRLVLEIIGFAALVALGAVEGTAGLIGVGLTAASWLGLLALTRQSLRAGEVLEEALRDGLGSDYRTRMLPELIQKHDGPVEWRRLVQPFRFSDPAVATTKDIQYVDDGKRSHRLDVYRPSDGRAGCPVLVYIHGGAWVMGDKREQGLPLMLHLAAHGWVCVTVNYRLSPRATFPDHLIDVKRALAWVREHIENYGGDPTFVAVCGGSAGGHITAMMALTQNDPEYQPGFEHADTSVQAAAPIYGVYDFLNREGFRGPGFGKFLLERSVMKVPASKHRDLYEKASPMDRVADARDVPPFFVVHGSNDSLVPVGEARTFARMLNEAGRCPLVYAELPGAQHAFEVFRSIRTAHLVTAVARFLAVAVAQDPSRRLPS